MSEPVTKPFRFSVEYEAQIPVALAQELLAEDERSAQDELISMTTDSRMNIVSAEWGFGSDGAIDILVEALG